MSVDRYIAHTTRLAAKGAWLLCALVSTARYSRDENTRGVIVHKQQICIDS